MIASAPFGQGFVLITQSSYLCYSWLYVRGRTKFTIKQAAGQALFRRLEFGTGFVGHVDDGLRNFSIA